MDGFPLFRYGFVDGRLDEISQEGKGGDKAEEADEVDGIARLFLDEASDGQVRDDEGIDEEHVDESGVEADVDDYRDRGGDDEGDETPIYGLDADGFPIPYIDIDAQDDLGAMMEQGLDVDEDQARHDHVRIDADGKPREQADEAHVPVRGVDDLGMLLPCAFRLWVGTNLPSINLERDMS